jgi:hypothetical protein
LAGSPFQNLSGKIWYHTAFFAHSGTINISGFCERPAAKRKNNQLTKKNLNIIHTHVTANGEI